MAAQAHNLSEIKQLLVNRRTALEGRRRRVELDLQRRFDPLVGDSSDRAIQLQNDETLQAIGDAASDELISIDEALRRVDAGLYGICKACGEQIESQRLETLHAVTCSRCAT